MTAGARRRRAGGAVTGTVAGQQHGAGASGAAVGNVEEQVLDEVTGLELLQVDAGGRVICRDGARRSDDGVWVCDVSDGTTLVNQGSKRDARGGDRKLLPRRL